MVIRVYLRDLEHEKTARQTLFIKTFKLRWSVLKIKHCYRFVCKNKFLRYSNISIYKPFSVHK